MKNSKATKHNHFWTWHFCFHEYVKIVNGTFEMKSQLETDNINKGHSFEWPQIREQQFFRHFYFHECFDVKLHLFHHHINHHFSW